MSGKKAGISLLLLFFCCASHSSEFTARLCPQLCDTGYGIAKDNSKAIGAFGACFIHCLMGEDTFDDVFRSNYRYLARFDEYATVGEKILGLLDNQNTAKAYVTYAKILFFLERVRGKLTRR